MIDWDEMFERTAPTIDGQLTAPDRPQPEAPVPVADTAPRADDRESLTARALDGDNRRRCVECANRNEHGRCLAAARGEIVAMRAYTPIADLLRRCEGFTPLPNDPDQRHGRDRWPGLVVSAAKGGIP